MFFQKYLLNYLILNDINEVVDIFKHKSLLGGDIYHCYNAATVLQMHKQFVGNNLRMSYKPLNRSNTTVETHNYAKVGIVVNTNCKGWSNVFDSVGTNEVFKPFFVWILVTDNLEGTTEILSQYKIELDSDVMIIVKEEDDYKLYEIYNTGFNKNGHLIVQEIGRWNKSLRMGIRERKNLKGLVLRSIIVIPEPNKVGNKTFVKYLEDEQPDLIKVDPMHKFKGYAALKYFRDMFNITYEFQQTSSWGYPTNGTFDGLVGALQRMEADIGGSPLFIRADRMNAIDYAAETWLTKPNFIFRHPKHPGGYHTIYTRPLTTKVWWCVIGLMLLSSVVLGVLLNIKIVRIPGDEDVSISLVLLFVWSAICQQGMTIGRSSNAAKMVMFTTFLFALTLYQYYNATVVSTLLHEQPKNIRTLSDLTQSNLKAGIEDILYNRDYFAHTTDPIARTIYLKKVAHGGVCNFYTPERGMEMVKRGGFAFHVDSAVAYRIMRRTFTEKELCELQEVSVFGSYLGLAVAKHSPYKEIMAYGVRKLSESGLLRRLSFSWDEPRPGCVRSPGSALISVSLPEFSAALVALALGSAAALILFTAELMVAKTRRVIPFKH